MESERIENINFDGIKFNIRKYGCLYSLTDFFIGITGKTFKTVEKYILKISFINKSMAEYITDKTNTAYYVNDYGLYLYITQLNKILTKQNKHTKYFIENIYNFILLTTNKFDFFKIVIRTIFTNLKYSPNNMYETKDRLDVLGFALTAIQKIYLNDQLIKSICKNTIGYYNYTYYDTIESICNIIKDNINLFLENCNDCKINILNEINNKTYYSYEVALVLFCKYVINEKLKAKIGTCSICFTENIKVHSPQLSYFINTKCECVGDDKNMCFHCLYNICNISIGTMNGSCPFCRKDIFDWFYTINSNFDNI
jgi:hypothetical protein